MKGIVEWYKESLLEINSNSSVDVADIHIDEILKVDSKSKIDLYEKSIMIWNELCSNVDAKDLLGKRLFMNLDIEDNDGMIKGVFRSLDKLISNVDLYGMPEILLCELNDNDNDQILCEYYKSPLPFVIEGLNINTKVTYHEYRRFEEMKDNEEYTRYISFNYSE